MAQIKVEVAGKDYILGCAEDDKDRLGELAKYVDERASALKEKLGHVAENRLLLMTALVIADELKDSLKERGLPAHLSGFSSDELAAIIADTAREVEEVADRLEAH